MINDLKVWPVLFDPSWNSLQRPLQVAIIVPNNRAGDPRRPVQVIMLQFGCGDIELALQPCEQRFELAAFLFQRVAAGEMEFPPRKIIALIRAGMRDEVLSSSSMWYCLSCYMCTVRCPRGVKPTELAHALDYL